MVKSYTTRVGSGPFPSELRMNWVNISGKRAENTALRRGGRDVAAGLTPLR
ncbi:MAG: hypothetical protein U0586_02715 [Candidatus Brocadiaceae bacterium]